MSVDSSVEGERKLNQSVSIEIRLLTSLVSSSLAYSPINWATNNLAFRLWTVFYPDISAIKLVLQWSGTSC